ncbi:MAG: glycine oxidase ThiO [Aridibacter famidurans]|nr:glycine oxidase ThiO [Aridibacter famidurans]
MAETHTSEVLIVGGGVIGLSIARALKKRGAGKITVVDRSSPGREASYAAAGMLAPQAEADSPDAFFRFCRESNRMYTRFAEELLDETGVDIELDDEGTLFLAFSDDDLLELSRRYEWQSGAGMRVEHLTAADTHKLEPFVSPDSLGSLVFPDDRQVENRALIKALLEFASRNGIVIVPDTEIRNVSESESAAEARSADGRRFEAGTMIVAAGCWTSQIEGAAPETGIPEVKPIRGQMIAFEAAKRFFRKVIYSHRGYIVPRKFGRILAGSTTEDAGFKDKTTDEGIETIRENAVEISPSLANLKIDESWSGLRPYCTAERPFIGKVPKRERTFAAVGHYRNGILLAPLTAEILAMKILDGAESEFLKIFGAGPAKAEAA